MNITVSYFQSKAPKERKVCIAKKPFRFLPGLMQATAFAPSNPWAEDWQTAYRADLDNRFPTPDSLRGYLRMICEVQPDPILCCYEKNPVECHRSVLAAYIKEKLGMAITEWSPEAEAQIPAPVTQTEAEQLPLL